MLEVVGFLEGSGGGSVSSMARRMESVMTSAYMMTLPSTWRAALPMVWTRAVWERR